MILDNYYRSWYANINNTSKLETYCLPQHTFGFEEYLDFIKDKKKYEYHSHNFVFLLMT